MTYKEIIGRNISAERGRLQISQTDVAARMRAAGFGWQQQTVAQVEKGKRGLDVEEARGLASVLECTLLTLVEISRPEAS